MATFDTTPTVTDAWVEAGTVRIQAEGQITTYSGLINSPWADEFSRSAIGIACIDPDEFLEALDITTDQLSTADFLATGPTIEQAQRVISAAGAEFALSC